MTATELIKEVGRLIYVGAHGLALEVKIIDAKETPEGLMYLITPTKGHGERWIEARKAFNGNNNA